MRLNPRQEELLHELVQKVIAKFPTVRYLGVSGSPYGEQSVWINVAVPEEETMMKMSEYAAELESAILVEYGYSFSIMPRGAEFAQMV
jgi:hypothetical protein